MKTIILCGGQGTRMKEETEFRPKPLVSIGGKPIIWHIMKIYAHYGYNDFILALGYKGDMIKEYFLHWRTFLNDFTLITKNNELTFHNNDCDDFRITFAETGLETLTGERVRQLKKYIDEDDFMVTYGDGVADVNIRELVDFHKKQNTIGTITGVHRAGRFGLIQGEPGTGKIKGFSQHNITAEPTKSSAQDYVNGGIQWLKKHSFPWPLPVIFRYIITRANGSAWIHIKKWRS
jgi:glucose-1-phosphate cytidylyltransferase